MSKLKKILACLCVLCSLVHIDVSADIIYPETVRVGLFYNNTALSAVNISSESLFLKGEGFEDIEGTSFNVGIGDGGFNINDTLYQLGKVEFHPNTGHIKVNSKPYRGYIRLLLTDKGINVINVVNTEEYLYGVVPLEMSTGWPIEALKAQALCARNYAISSIGRFEQYGFDLTDTTLSQVYGGVNVEKPDCTQAVEETRGMLVSYNGKLAETFYFSTSSGETLDVKDVWGSTNYPYLVSVDDSLQVNVKKDHGAWKATFTKSELTDIFNKKGLELGEIQDVTIDEYNEQNAVMKITFVGANGSKSYTKGSTRDVLSLRSQVYTMTKNTSGGESKEVTIKSSKGETKTKLAFNVASSKGVTAISDKVSVVTANGTSFIENVDGEFNGITLNGTGYGHGIGMSQNGAKALANAGYSFEQIIKHYFTGVEIYNSAE